jgi:N-methylhydantoinase B
LKRDIDPITLEVIRGGLVSLSREMGVAMEKTSYSTIFSEGLDYSCAVFDWEGNMVALHAFDPCHLGAMPYSVQASIREFGIQNLQPGDIILQNDPYNGGSHINDYTIMTPVFVDNELVVIPATRAHQIDAGAANPGGCAGDATSIHEEGLRLPPIRLYSAGKEMTDIWNILLANVRVPTAVRGDMRAMIGSLRVAERRATEYVKKYGIGTWKAALTEIMNISERIMREEIDAIPDGEYENEEWMDDSGTSSEPVRLKVRVEIKGSELTADYSGSSPQVNGPINASYAVTACNTYIGVLHCVGHRGEYPVNQGTFRPIKVKAPQGSVVNVTYPAACIGGNTETSNRIVDLVIGALLQATTPRNIKAACHGTGGTTSIGGIDHETGEQYVIYLYSLGGMGARATKDGNSAQLPFATNNKGPYAEINETRYPILVEEYSLVQDSAGIGRFRGGLGTRFRFRLLAESAEYNCLGDRHKISPYGVFGGLPPNPSECGHFCDIRIKLANEQEFKHSTELFGKISTSKWSKMILHRGDVYEISLCGGGGFGNPLDRDPELVRKDVEYEYVSNAVAREYYGVVIDPTTTKIDQEATGKLRTEKQR